MTTVLRLKQENVEAIARLFKQLRARMRLDHERLGAPLMALRFSARMRYAGQGYELSVDLPDDPTAQSFISVVLERFAEVYRRTYGYSHASTIVEGVRSEERRVGEE